MVQELEVMTSSCHLPRMGLIHTLVPQDSRNASTRVQSPLTITISPAPLNVPGSTNIYAASLDQGAGVTCSNTAIAVGKVRFLHRAKIVVMFDHDVHICATIHL